jgi:hypothetical protein
VVGVLFALLVIVVIVVVFIVIVLRNKKRKQKELIQQEQDTQMNKLSLQINKPTDSDYVTYGGQQTNTQYQIAPNTKNQYASSSSVMKNVHLTNQQQNQYLNPTTGLNSSSYAELLSEFEIPFSDIIISRELGTGLFFFFLSL